MSRVPYTINVEEYICTAIEQMRKMNECRDYSGLSAAIERVQHHANNMENGLYSYNGIKHDLKRWLEDETLSLEDFKKKCQEAIDRLEKQQG